MVDLDGIFKAYDVRGVVPDQLDEPTARRIGGAFARLLERRSSTTATGRPPVVIGHDMRTSSPGLAAAFAAGVVEAGFDALSIGLAATDEVYYASGTLDAPGAMVTASHNPSAYNGFKLCFPGAVALSAKTGLDEIHQSIASPSPAATAHPPAATPLTLGSLRETDILPAYVDHVLRSAPVAGRRLTVVVDAANGMAGHTVPAVFAHLDVELVPLYFELDGTFPHHEANPLVAENLRDVSAAVVREGADLGLAFDGDADRCFAVDERGRPVPPSVLTSLIAIRELEKHPGAHVIHNLITSRAVSETITAHGGIPVRTPVGHSLIKAEMARTDAVFGGEHSGHYYFRDFWYADSGMLAALHLISSLAATTETLSAMAASLDPYCASGEINLTVADPAAVLERVSTAYTDRADVELDTLDGVSVIGQDWWLNVRSSNTEPLVRLNVEAADDATMGAVRDSTLALMRSET